MRLMLLGLVLSSAAACGDYDCLAADRSTYEVRYKRQ
jgi:hypothetical protein